MSIQLAGNASTNSRGKRPLPPGALSAQTLSGVGARELTEFAYADGRRERRTLLSWVIGQHGCLWGHGPLPYELENVARQWPGSYGHAAEFELADALGAALDGVFTSPDLACRFGLSGRDALDAAARVARAATGRAPIAAEYSYHGCGEAFVHPPYPDGIPQGYRDLSQTFAWLRSR